MRAIKLAFLCMLMISCRSVEKTKSTTVQDRQETTAVKSDSIVRNTTAAEKVERTTIELSDLNFKIIPSKQDDMQRTYAFTDKNGNTVAGTVNPRDTIEFRNNTVTIEQFEQMKELKEYYEQRAISAEKRLSDHLDKNIEDLSRKPNPLKWIWSIVIAGILIYVISLLWPKR